MDHPTRARPDPRPGRPAAERTTAARIASTVVDDRRDGVAQPERGVAASESPRIVAQRRLAETLQQSPRATALRTLSAALDDSPLVAARRRQLDGMFGTPAQPEAALGGEGLPHGRSSDVAQRQAAEDDGWPQGGPAPVQRRGSAQASASPHGGLTPIQRLERPAAVSNPAVADLHADRAAPAQAATAPGTPTPANDTGLPDHLRAGIEQLSGLSMAHVKVHYNAARPAQLNALAYAQGSDIHVAPGQERHLPHEAWHVVQQAQGRVRPTVQLKDGVSVSDDPGLEHEADVMGAKAAAAASVLQARQAAGSAPSGGGPRAAVGTARPSHAAGVVPRLPAAAVIQRMNIARFKIGNTASIEELVPAFKGKSSFDTAKLSLGDLEALVRLLQEDHKFKTHKTDLARLGTELDARRRDGQEKEKEEAEEKGEKEEKEEKPARSLKEGPPKPGKVLRLPEPSEEVKKLRTVRYGQYVEHLARSHDAFAGKSLGEVLGDVDMHAFDAVDFGAMSLACQKRQTRASMVEGCIEQLYSGIPWEGRIAITVYTDERQGKGDLVLAMKTVQILREAFPKAAPDDIALMMDQTTIRSSVDPVALAKGYDIDPVTMPYGRGVGRLTDTKGKGPQTFIRAPLLSSEQQLQGATDFLSFAPKDRTQHIAFTEYAKREPGATPTGVKPEELGIMVHQGLRRYKDELARMKTPEAAREFKLGHLLDMTDQRLLQAIVADPGASPQELADTINAQPPTKQALAQFVARGAKLYFGYSNRSGVKFAKTVAEIERDNKEDIDIVHPGAENMATQLPGFKEELVGSYQAVLRDAGVHRVELVEFNAMTGNNPETKTARTPMVVEITKGLEKPKTMRLVYLPAVSPGDMQILFKASEKTVQTTGNQSTSEALSAGKNVLYECLAFAQNQQFMEDFHTMGSGVDGGQDMMKLHAAQREADKDILTGDKEQPHPDAYKNVAALLREGRMDTGFDNLSDRVCTTKDFRSRLVGMYKRQMLMQFPVGKDLNALEEAIRGDPSTENFDRLAQGLVRLMMQAKEQARQEK